MVNRDKLVALLPVRNQEVLIEDRQNTDDIRKLILYKHKQYKADYALISHYFDKGDVVDTSREIFDFLKRNVPYTKENNKYQTVKSPAAIILHNDGSGPFDRVDCKNYASFAAGVLDSIKRNNGGSWDWCYRFASYDEQDKEPGHVFVVVKTKDGELWIDPVFTYFNAGMMHEWELDETPGRSIGGLYSISGPDNVNSGTNSVIVNTRDAATNWLVALNMGLFSLPDLMKAFPQITNSPALLKTLTDCGVNLISLQAILNQK